MLNGQAFDLATIPTVFLVSLSLLRALFLLDGCSAFVLVRNYLNYLKLKITMDVWGFYEDLERQVDQGLPELTAHCEVVIEKLWEIKDILNVEFSKLGELYGEFKPEEQFILPFFIRNLAYLIAAYKLTKMGLTNPARNNTRTVYEQVLRSILFSKYPEEALLWYNFIETPEDDPRKDTFAKEIRDNPRRYWSVSYMQSKLYKDDLLEGHVKFYETISRYSHPNIISLWSDFGDLHHIEDNLRGILGLSYNTVDVFQETFSSKMSDKLNSSLNAIKGIIGSHLKEIDRFTPNI